MLIFCFFGYKIIKARQRDTVGQNVDLKLKLQIIPRADTSTVYSDLKVNMRTCRTAGAAGPCDKLAFLDLLAYRSNNARVMTIERNQSVAVVNHNKIAVAACIPSRKDNLT